MPTTHFTNATQRYVIVYVNFYCKYCKLCVNQRIIVLCFEIIWLVEYVASNCVAVDSLLLLKAV